jgi:predicted signal transduction protein with EAL and GGDEF domain
VFRTGGDEFTILVEADAALSDLDGFAEEVLTRLSTVMVCEGHTIIPRGTIGGALVAITDRTPETVLQNADIALYHAKEVRRGGFVRYWPGIDTRIMHRIAAVRIERGSGRGRIEAHYQPIVQLDTYEIIGLEALCRLRMAKGDVLRREFSGCDRRSQGRGGTDCAHARTGGAGHARRAALGLHGRPIGINVSKADFLGGRLEKLVAMPLSIMGSTWLW